MDNLNAQNPNMETAEQFAKESAIYKETFDATDGDYETRNVVAREAVAKYRQETLGEKFRGDLARVVTEAAPSPESDEPSADVAKLNQEQINTWLEKYKGDLRGALVDMLKLEPKFRMTDEELDLLVGELEDPKHIEQETFFALTDYIERIRRNGKEVNVREDEVVKGILLSIANNQPPAGLKAA